MNVTRIRLHPTNCYLVGNAHDTLLIDTAYPGRYPRFRKALRRQGLSLQSIKNVLLTHHHDDHAGLLADLRKDTDLRLIVHREAVEHLKRGATDLSILATNLRTGLLFSVLFLLNRHHRYPNVEPSSDDWLVDEDCDLVCGGGEIRGKIVHTPGHSVDSISLILDDGSAFVGDLATHFLPILGLEHRPVFVDAMSEVFRSWKKILRMGARRIYPGHGTPFAARELTAAMDRLGVA